MNEGDDLSLIGPSLDQLRQRLRTVFASLSSREGDGKRAAVAIVVGEDHGSLGFLLSRRSSSLRTHSGQYALPGGRLDADESVEQAALRELHEEIGLRLSPDDIVGRLPDYQTHSGYLITPVVAWAPDLSGIDPNPDEVETVFHIPLTALAGPAVPTLLRTPGSDKPIIQLPLGGDRNVHAPTGAILYQFAEALRGRYIDAQAFEEPEWARR